MAADPCGPFWGAMWLVIVDDAKTKWPEVVKMGSTTAEATIAKIMMITATHGPCSTLYWIFHCHFIRALEIKNLGALEYEI